MQSAKSGEAILHDVRIATPCRELWRNMEGDEQVRFCSVCRLNVYNFSAMSAEEATKVLREKEGRVCGRFYARRDGTMLTTDGPSGVRSMARRRLGWMGLALGVLVAFAGAAVRSNRALPNDPSRASAIERLADSVRHVPVIGQLADRICPQQTMGVIAMPGPGGP